MGQCPKFIAELSGNHGGSIDSAYAHIDAAAAAGADFVKIQTYKPETITINSNLPDFLINDSKSLWYGVLYGMSTPKPIPHGIGIKTYFLMLGRAV